MNIKKKTISIEEILRVQNDTASSQDYIDVINASCNNEEISELLTSEESSECDEDIALWNNLFNKYGDEIEEFLGKAKIIKLPEINDVEVKIAAIKPSKLD